MPAENYLCDQPGFYRHIAACNRHQPADFLPLLWQGREIGLIKRANGEILAGFPEVFQPETGQIHLLQPAALGDVVASLAADKLIDFRDEPYRVGFGWHEPPIAEIDRGAYVFFGIRAYGIHLNGYVRRSDGLYLGLAHRALDRGVCPGQLDQIVAGGLPAGLTAFETMRKEADEEAAIPPALANKAQAAGTVTYLMDRPRGISRDTIFTFDLELPSDFTPHNRDGEVARFEFLPVADVAEIVRTTDRFKWNCNLVIIDFLIRHGYLDSRHPEYTALCPGLHRAL